MIAVKILDIKNFTAGFLTGTWLDTYELAEASMTTFCTMTIDGSLQKDFFGTENEEAVDTEKEERDQRKPKSLVSWKSVKPYCFSFLKGKKLPLSFKFVFFFPHEQIPSFLSHYELKIDDENVRGLCMNLRYDNGGLVLTSGTVLGSFSLDRSVEHTWDNYVKAWLRYHKVAFEEL